MFKDLLFDDILTKFKQIDAVNERLFRQIVTFSFTCTLNGLGSVSLIL